MTTPSKITDYFPPSPKAEVSQEEDKEIRTEKDVNEKVDEVENVDKKLSESSVVITPNPSPYKDESASLKEVKEEPSTEQKPEEKPILPSCKKSLPLEQDSKKTETVVKQPTKSKRKGRRKKTVPKAETQETGSPVLNGPAKPKTAKKKQTGSETKNTLLTDFFPVRRSDRRNKTEVEKEKIEALHYKILNDCEDGLNVEEIKNKGRGVVATKLFKKGDFVVNYAGDLIDLKEAKNRDEEYSKDPSKGCYMYYFNFKNKTYCVDATAESGKLGRLLNHSKSTGNCQTKLVGIKDMPYLIIVASRDVSAGEELTYDYGDRSKTALESHPWLKS